MTLHNASEILIQGLESRAVQHTMQLTSSREFSLCNFRLCKFAANHVQISNSTLHAK